MSNNLDRFKFRVRFYGGYVPQYELDQYFTEAEDGTLYQMFREGGALFDAVLDPSEAIRELCTGLKDSKGKLIYEGDVVQAQDYAKHCDKFSIKWLEGGFCATQTGVQMATDLHIFYPSVGCRIRVVGNIHDNPELLR